MNKTQIREALEIKKNRKINSIKEAELQAQDRLLKLEINENFGTTLKQINEILSNMSGKNKLINLVESLKDSVENSKGFKFDNSYSVQAFVSFLNYGFDDSVEFGYRNEKSLSLSNERKTLVSKVESEYRKLDQMLIKMNANDFYNYLLSIGINLEVKEVEKPQLPSVEINASFL